jgi:hypothetical protein
MTKPDRKMLEYFAAAPVIQKGPVKYIGGKPYTERREGKLSSIRSLKTPEDISQKTKGRISTDRLVELADAKLIPHYQVEGEIYFQSTEALDWLADNLCLRVPGSPVPYNISLTPVYVEGPEDFPLPSEIKTLSQFLIPLRVSGLRAAVYPGVYFLVKDNEVVYVGQSVSVAKRIGAHFENKDFDHAFCMRVPRSDMNYVEGQFIRALKPKYNYGADGRLHRPSGERNYGASPTSIAAVELLSAKDE